MTIASILNPSSTEAKVLQREILVAQRSSDKRSPGIAVPKEVRQSDLQKQRAAAVQAHVSEARRLAKSKRYDQALDEIAHAYALDPLNEEVANCETEIRRSSLTPGNLAGGKKKFNHSVFVEHLRRAKEGLILEKGGSDGGSGAQVGSQNYLAKARNAVSTTSLPGTESVRSKRSGEPTTDHGERSPEKPENANQPPAQSPGPSIGGLEDAARAFRAAKVRSMKRKTK